jgi:hypothetical protein
MMLDPGMVSATIAGLRVRLYPANTPGAIGSAMVL